MARLAEEDGTIKSSEEDFIQKIFKFDDVSVKKVMTPLKKIVSISADSELKKVLSKIMKSGYSRIPVYLKQKTNFIGIVYVKDLLKYINEKKPYISIKRIMRPVFFVPGNKKIDVLLDRFQKNREHLAVIVNDDNKVIGMVTLEDIIEEIVGEIYDEVEKKDF